MQYQMFALHLRVGVTCEGSKFIPSNIVLRTFGTINVLYVWRFASTDMAGWVSHVRGVILLHPPDISIFTCIVPNVHRAIFCICCHGRVGVTCEK